MATSKKKRKKKPWKLGATSGHIKNLKQSIFVFRYLWSALKCVNFNLYAFVSFVYFLKPLSIIDVKFILDVLQLQIASIDGMMKYQHEGPLS